MFSRNRVGQGSLAYKIQPSIWATFWGRVLSPFSMFSRRSSHESIRNLLAQSHDVEGGSDGGAEEPFGSVRNYHVVGVRHDEKKAIGSR